MSKGAAFQYWAELLGALLFFAAVVIVLNVNLVPGTEKVATVLHNLFIRATSGGVAA